MFQCPELSHPQLLSKETLAEFTDFMRTVFLFVGLLLLANLGLGSRKNQGEARRYSFRVWIFGILSILGVTTISLIIFNPVGVFTWNLNNDQGKDTRLVKSYLYNQLNSTPDIIFLGSSVSFLIPAQKYAQEFSLSGFNFSVQGGTIVDYFTLSNLSMSRSTNINKPRVIVIEILSPHLTPTFNRIPYYKNYPVEYVQYMPLNFAFKTLSTHLGSFFAASSISEVIFVKSRNLQFSNSHYSSSDGSRERQDPLDPVKDASYKKRLAGTWKALDKQLWCKEPDPGGKDLLREIVALSQQRHISLVFYRPPINKDFYVVLKKDPAHYQRCANKFGQLMKQIQKKNSNVFYVDLSSYTPLSTGGKTLFIDSHHLNSVGTDHLLEALRPTIQAAIAHARSQ